jgi:hypothetical protein
MLICMESYLHSPVCFYIVHGDVLLCLVTLLLFRAVGIPTGYGLGGLRLAPTNWRSQWSGGGGEVPYSFRPSSRSTQSGYLVSFPRVKRPGPGVNHEPFSSASVRLCYIYRVKFTFTLVPSLHGICGK